MEEPACPVSIGPRSGRTERRPSSADLLEGLRRNRIVWQLADHIRSLFPMVFDLQPHVILGMMVELSQAIHTTLDCFPQEPAGRHAGPNTAAAPALAPEVFTPLIDLVGGHLDAIESALTIDLELPEMPLNAFRPLALNEFLDPMDDIVKRVYGLDHLDLLLEMPSMGMLEELSVRQLYLGDASIMAQRLGEAVKEPWMYFIKNLGQVEVTNKLRDVWMNLSRHLETMANALKNGLVDQGSFTSLGDIDQNNFTFLAMAQGYAFSSAAQKISGDLRDLIDYSEDLQDPTDRLSLLSKLVNEIINGVNACWTIPIKYQELPTEEEEFFTVKKRRN